MNEMGKQDLWQSDYFDDKKRFADMFNGALFDGNQIMKLEDLEEADPNIVYHDKEGNAHNVIRDKVYKWKGCHASICILENQSYIDYRMIFRIMFSEALNYFKQQKHAFRKWKELGYKFDDEHEFLSKMRKDEKFIPIITLVLYFGKDKKWDGAKFLYDLLNIDEELKPFVSNYKINLFDYHEHTDFSKFITENRILLELLASSKDADAMDRIMRKYFEGNLAEEEVAKAILGILDVNIDLTKYENKMKEGVKVYMCKAWDDHRERGRLEGLQQGIEQGKEQVRKQVQEEQQSGLRALVNILSKMYPDFDSIYNAIISEEKYSGITREQIREFYSVH